MYIQKLRYQSEAASLKIEDWNLEASQHLLLIGRALIKQPALLILDEPYQGLDFINRKLVYFALNRIAKANLSQLLYVTHYEEDALEAINHFVDFVPAIEGHKALISHQ